MTILEEIKKMLSIERKGINDELERLDNATSRQFSGRDDVFSSILNFEYLTQLKASNILELKVAMASNRGIIDLQNRLLKLKGISEREYETVHELRRAKENLYRKMRRLLDGGTV